jgi:RecJ-like exonuclease
MNEKLPAPCEACRGTGLHKGSECSECGGKGYRLFINGNETPVRREKPQRWQGPRPVQRQR